MALTPTLTLFDVEARKEGSSDRQRWQWIDKMTEELRAFSNAGGEVLFATDVGYTDHFDTALEFTDVARRNEFSADPGFSDHQPGGQVWICRPQWTHCQGHG